MVAKGKVFENEIFEELKKIDKDNKGFFIKSATPVQIIRNKNNNYIYTHSGKAICDIMGIYKSKFVLMELKEVSGERFSLLRLKDHQIFQLSKIKHYGGLSLIVFNLKKEECILVVKIEDYLVYKTQIKSATIKIRNILDIGVKIKSNKIIEVLNKLIT